MQDKNKILAESIENELDLIMTEAGIAVKKQNPEPPKEPEKQEEIIIPEVPKMVAEPLEPNKMKPAEELKVPEVPKAPENADIFNIFRTTSTSTMPEIVYTPEEPKKLLDEVMTEPLPVKKKTKGKIGLVQFKNVKKTYRMGESEIRALDGIDFSIDEGEFVIVVGASGAGKSTILNILGGMDKATSGQMIVDGKIISGYNKKQMTLYRRYDVGFVFQSYNLVQNLTARENVELATQVSKNPLDIDKTIAAVGLSERSKNFPSQLSGGEQQRVAIARALAKNPKMLLCDEPTGALDYNTGKSILKLLQDTARSNNMTVIIVTHNTALTTIGDKVIKVKSGKIESVSHNEHPMDIADVEW